MMKSRRIHLHCQSKSFLASEPRITILYAADFFLLLHKLRQSYESHRPLALMPWGSESVGARLGMPCVSAPPWSLRSAPGLVYGPGPSFRRIATCGWSPWFHPPTSLLKLTGFGTYVFALGILALRIFLVSIVSKLISL